MSKCKYCSVDAETTKRMQDDDSWYIYKDKKVMTKGFKGGAYILDGWSYLIDLTNSRLLLDYDVAIDAVDIKFCPFCGRKLGADTNGS